MITTNIAGLRTRLIEDRPIGIERFNLTDGQRWGLLQAWRGELAMKIIPHLDAMGCPKASPEDWGDLCRRSMLKRRSNGLHTITPYGLMVATEVARDFAGKFGVHAYMFRRGESSGHSASCSCGRWFSSSPKTISGEAMMARAWRSHVDYEAIDPGEVERAKRTAAIFEQVAAAGAQAIHEFRSTAGRAAPLSTPHLPAPRAGADSPRSAPVPAIEAR